MLSLLTTLGDNISKSLNDLANISEINLFIRTMNIRFRAANTHSDNLSLRVLLFKFLKEGDRATLSKGANGQTIEIAVRSLSEACI